MQPFMHIHLVALRYFREAVRRGSMRGAADALNVAPSAVNRQILKLEGQIGCALFERLPDGLRLTSAGEVLYRYARELDAGLDRALSEIDDLRGMRRGSVALAAEDGVARDVLPPVLGAYHAEFPRVTHRLEVAGSAAVVEAVAGAACEIGLAIYAPRHPDVQVLTEPQVEMGVVVPPGHPIAALRCVRLSDLVGERLVLLQDGGGASPEINAALRRAARSAQVAEVSAPGVLSSLVRAGLGLAVRSRIGIASEIAAGEVAFVPLRDPSVRPARLSLLVRRDRALPVPAAVMAERLKAALEAMGGV